jgi:hypothetical protein
VVVVVVAEWFHVSHRAPVLTELKTKAIPSLKCLVRRLDGILEVSVANYVGG